MAVKDNGHVSRSSMDATSPSGARTTTCPAGSSSVGDGEAAAGGSGSSDR